LWQIWLWSVLQDPRYFALLLEFDVDLVAGAKLEGCRHCGGRLHRGDFERKPRGGPRAGLPATFNTRFSLCCSVCRHRQTPPSLRFLGRKVYLGVVVVLVAAMQHGVSPPRASQLRKALGISRQTLERWRDWWRESFGTGRFFKSLRGLFSEATARERLPLSLLAAVDGRSLVEALKVVLRLLLPITTLTAPLSQPL
jgi:hypothetical protein